MAFWKRRSQSFEPVSPQTRYTVSYLGHEELRGKVGLDNTLKPVDDMYRKYKSLKSKTVRKMDIEVVSNGIKVEPLDEGVRTMFADSQYFVAEGPFGNVFFPINKLSFGAADPYHNKIFCFVSRNENPAMDHYWDCHAVFCESSAMAKNLTLYLVKSFQRLTSKDDPFGAAQKSKRPTTVHILKEKGTSEHQIHARRKKRPPVSTLSVILNVGETDLKENDFGNSNRAVADIIAHRAKRDLGGGGGGDSDVSNGNSVSKEIGTSSSDKENDLMEGILSDDDMTQSTSPRELEVTVAFNPDLNSPPESPRKATSPRGGRTSSGDENDVAFRNDPRSGETSPQDMITTMSPPDTPGYLSKEGKSPSPTLTNAPTKPPSPRQHTNSSKAKAPSPPSQTSVIPGSISPRKQNSPSKSVVSSKPPSPSPSPKSFNYPPDVPSTNARRSTPSPTSPKTSPVSLSPVKSSPPRKEDEPSGVRRRSPPSTATSTMSGANPDDVQKKPKKDRKSVRKSVRFADDEDLIQS